MDKFNHFLFFSLNIRYKRPPFFTITKLFLLFQVTFVTKAKIETINIEDPESSRLDENVTINLLKATSKDFHWLIINRKYNDEQTGPKRWNKSIPMEKTN